MASLCASLGLDLLISFAQIRAGLLSVGGTNDTFQQFCDPCLRPAIKGSTAEGIFSPKATPEQFSIQYRTHLLYVLVEK